MERSILWFKCAAMHDPVRPVLRSPAVIGWEGQNRRIDLEIERPFKGEELLLRMKGWFTADVHKVAEIIKEHGKLKILDDNSLIVETKDFITTEVLSGRLKELFGEEVWIEHLPKSNNRNIIAE